METKVYYEWFTVDGKDTHRVARLEVQAAKSGNTYKADFWSWQESKRVEGKASGGGYCKASAATCASCGQIPKTLVVVVWPQRWRP